VLPFLRAVYAALPSGRGCGGAAATGRVLTARVAGVAAPLLCPDGRHGRAFFSMLLSAGFGKACGSRGALCYSFAPPAPVAPLWLF